MLIDDLQVHRDLHVQALGTLHGGVPSGLPDQLLAELGPHVSAFEAARGKIEKDANLTAVGRQNALAEEREKATAAITTWVSGRTEAIESQMAALRRTQEDTAAQAQPVPSAAAVATMAAHLQGLDPLEVEILYSDATEPEKLTIEHAVAQIGRRPARRPDGAVVWEHVMDPSRVASARAARVAAADPARAARLRDLARIQSTYAAMASAARSLLT